MGSELIGKTVRNPLRAALLAGVTGLALAAASGTAQAGPETTNLNISSALSGGPFATVTLTQKSTNTVNVSVKTLDSFGIVGTSGTHQSFAFNLDSTNETVHNISFSCASTTNCVSSPTLASVGPGSLTATPYGDFTNAIHYDTHGGSHPLYGTLSFDVTGNNNNNITINDFIANSDNYYFAADMISGSTTGSVATKDAPSVPEPGSLALLGTGLLGLGLVMHRKRRRT